MEFFNESSPPIVIIEKNEFGMVMVWGYYMDNGWNVCVWANQYWG